MTFECIEGCGKCCWAVPISRDTWDEHADDVQQEVLQVWPFCPDLVLPITANLHCPFLTADKKCAIHDDRPDVCRNYGGIKNHCPYVRVNGTPRTPGGVERELRRNPVDLDQESNVTLLETVPLGSHEVIVRMAVEYRKVEV